MHGFFTAKTSSYALITIPKASRLHKGVYGLGTAHEEQADQAVEHAVQRSSFT